MIVVNPLWASYHMGEANKCIVHFNRFEQQNKIPSNLLHAIALAESGRTHDISKKKYPWPWTVNVAGKGYFFETKKEAVNFVKAKRMQGITSIDVGCMQINLHHHPNAFANLDQAFEPHYNIAYSAQFLRNHFDKQLNWTKAVANYHSQTENLGSKYAENVFKYWNNYSYQNNSRVNYASYSSQKDNATKRARIRSEMLIKIKNNHAPIIDQKNYKLALISKKILHAKKK